MVAGAIAGPIAGKLATGIGLSVSGFGAAVMGGALTGGLSGGINAKLQGGNFREGFINGAKAGAVTGALIWGATNAKQIYDKHEESGGDGPIDMDDLVDSVYKDYPSLPRPKGLKIEGVARIYENGKTVWGWWESQDRILVATAGRAPEDVQATVFHELLHVDEASYWTFGRQSIYSRYRAIFDNHDWIDKTASQYNTSLRVHGYPKPSLDGAPWRWW
jgi:hypothetical protein